MRSKLLTGMYLLFSLIFAQAQITFTRDFTNKLEDAGAHISIAEDNWFNVTVCTAGKISYDLCVYSERDSAEIKYIIFPETKTNKILFPEVHFVSKISNMAMNDDSYWIRTRSFTHRVIEDSLRADWAGELSFVPQKSLTDKKYAKAFALYKEDYGMIYAILFYNLEFPHFNEHLHSISFYKNF